MTSKNKFSSLLKGKSVPNLPSYTAPWNKNDEKLWTALKKQNVKQVKSILSKSSATPTKLGPQGKSVFHLACEMGNEQIVDAVLLCTQDVNETSIQGVTALQRAAARGHTSTVNKLLQKEANVNQRDCDGMTALHHACFGQHTDCVLALLSKNADVSAVEQGGKTPLFYSAHGGHYDICRWLLDRGADVNCQDKELVTPLMLTAKEGHRPVCELLLRRGAQPHLVDKSGHTALNYAVTSKKRDLVELLEQALPGDMRVNSHNNLELQHLDPTRRHQPLLSSSVSLDDSGQSARVASIQDNESTSRADIHSIHSTSRADVHSIHSTSQADAHSIHSMDDTLLSNYQSSLQMSRMEQAYRNLEEEHQQLQDKFGNLSQDNLRLKQEMKSILSRQAEQKMMGTENGSSSDLEKTRASEKSEESDLSDEKQAETEQENRTLLAEVESLKTVVTSLHQELNLAKSQTSAGVNLVASNNFEDIRFDEEGFVQDQDVTKEEFLQIQNQQLKVQCRRLTEELDKLRLTFEAILKAGDNLQADYDHLALDRDALQDDLESAVKAKQDVLAENEFLLADNNNLHDNLRKIVQELEKMQDMYQAAQAENEELTHKLAEASKLDNVEQLVEERGLFQLKCADLEETVGSLEHQQQALVEDVAGLTKSLQDLALERDQLEAELRRTQLIGQELETLQSKYNQMQTDYVESQKKSMALSVSTQTESHDEREGQKKLEILTANGESDRWTPETKETDTEHPGRLEGLVQELSNHALDLENKVRDLEEELKQYQEADKTRLTPDSSQDGGSGSLHDETSSLKKQLAQLTQELEEMEQRYLDTVHTYRTHLLSAVQGHMDQDVKDALYHIIELRSMEQFC